MSTGSGGSEDVEREPGLFNSVKDFSMMILGLGMEANIWAYRVNFIQASVITVEKRIKQNREKSWLNYYLILIILNMSLVV